MTEFDVFGSVASPCLSELCFADTSRKPIEVLAELVFAERAARSKALVGMEFYNGRSKKLNSKGLKL